MSDMIAHIQTTREAAQAEAQLRAVTAATRRRRRWRTWLGIALRGAMWLGVAVLAFVFVDALWPLAAGVRFGVGLMLVTALSWQVRRAWTRRGGDPDLAEVRRLQDARAVEGSALINALSLAPQARQDGDDLPAILARRALAAGSLIAAAIDPRAAVPLRPLRAPLQTMLIVALVWAGLLAVQPRLAGVGLARLVDPWGDHPPFSLTVFDVAILPRDLVEGGDAEVAVRVSGLRPGETTFVELTEGARQAHRWPMRLSEQGIATRTLRDVRQPITFYIETDTGRSKRHTITPRLATPARVEARWAEGEGGPLFIGPGEARQLRLIVSNDGESSAHDLTLGASVIGTGLAEQPAQAQTLSDIEGQSQRSVSMEFTPPRRSGVYELRVAIEGDGVAPSATLTRELHVRPRGAAEHEGDRRLIDEARLSDAMLRRLSEQIERLRAEAASLSEKMEAHEPQSPPEWMQQRGEDLADRLDRLMADADALARAMSRASGDNANRAAALTRSLQDAADTLARIKLKVTAADRPGKGGPDATQGSGAGGFSDTGIARQWLQQLMQAASADRRALDQQSRAVADALEAYADAAGLALGQGDGGAALALDPEGRFVLRQAGQGEHVDSSAADVKHIPPTYLETVSAYLDWLAMQRTGGTP